MHAGIGNAEQIASIQREANSQDTCISGSKFHSKFSQLAAQNIHGDPPTKINENGSTDFAVDNCSVCRISLLMCQEVHIKYFLSRDVYVMNIEQNHVAGSSILTLLDSQWNVLIPCFGFGNFSVRNRRRKRKFCKQEMQSAFWNTSRQKLSGGQSKPALKDVPSKLTMMSYFNYWTSSLLFMRKLIFLQMLLHLILPV